LYVGSKAPAWRTEFFYEHGIIRSKDFIPASEALVRQDWKYMFWPDFGVEQLFHLKRDPFEETDVVAQPAHAAVLSEMRRRFAELKAAAAAPL
jgi:arylsulfatase A-like enzyme